MPLLPVARRTPSRAGRAGEAAGASGERDSDMGTSGSRLLLLRLFQRLAVRAEAFDLCPRSQRLNILADGLLRQLRVEIFLRLFERDRLGGAAILDLDHVPAELRAHWLGRNLAGLHGEGSIGELLDHVVAAEEAQVATVLRRRVL